MLKRHFFILVYLVLFSISSGFANNSQERFDFLFESSVEYSNDNTNLAQIFLDSAFAIAYENGHLDQLGRCANQQGRIFHRSGKLDSAEHYYNQSLNFFDGSDDPNKFKVIKNLGVLAYFRGDMATAIDKHITALDHYLGQNDATEIATTYSNLGVFYKNNGQFIMASETYIKSLKYFEEVGDSAGLANVYNNIGSIYVDQQRFTEASSYFRRAVAHSELGSVQDRAIWYNNMSLALRELDVLDSAQYYQLMALDMRSQLGDSSGIAQSYHELGLQSIARRDYSEAKNQLQHAFSIAKRIGDVKYQAVIINNLAETELLQNQPEKAIQTLSLYKSINAPIQVYSELKRQKHLASAYHQLGDDQIAFEHLRKFEILSDSAKNLRLNQQLDDLNTYYEAEKKEQVIKDQALTMELVEAQHHSDIRLVLLIVGTIVLFIGGVLVYLRYINLKKGKQLLKGKVEIAKTQMSPEFLYNSLDIVSELLEQSTAASEEAIYKLSRLYQKMVENFDEDLVPLEEELELVESYIDLMDMCQTIKFEFKNEIQNPEQYAVVPFSLQALFDNAISREPVEVVQSIRLYDSDRSIVVENQSTGEFLKAVYSFPFINEKYKIVCGRGISVELPEYGTLIKIPKIQIAI